MPTIVATLDPVSNRETWIDAVQLFDHETDETINLVNPETLSALIDSAKIEVRDQNKGGTRLSGTLDDGTISLHVEGVLQWQFSADQMKTLGSGTYDVGAILSKDGETIQILLGQIPILDGVVGR